MGQGVWTALPPLYGIDGQSAAVGEQGGPLLAIQAQEPGPDLAGATRQSFGPGLVTGPDPLACAAFLDARRLMAQRLGIGP